MFRITLEEWIEYFGFKRFPFERLGVGGEYFTQSDYVTSGSFVEPDGFSELLGDANAPATSILFAARGAGKTSCRVMLDYYCQQGTVPYEKSGNYVLSVPYHNFSNILNKIDTDKITDFSQERLLELHAREIINRSIPQFARMLQIPGLAKKVEELDPKKKADISWFIYQYSNYLIDLELIESLGALGVFPYEKLKKSLEDWIIGALETRKEQHPIEHLSYWAKLMPTLGIESIYLLVDGIDETSQTASSSMDAYSLIRPLLTNLRLMDGTEHFALKFFLPDYLTTTLQGDGAFRKDRGFIIQYLNWIPKQLAEILHKRLEAIKSTDEQQTLIPERMSEICVMEIRYSVEDIITKEAEGNPRYMFLICGLMVLSHIEKEYNDLNDESSYLLNKLDLQTALARFENIRRETEKVYQLLEPQLAVPENRTVTVISLEEKTIEINEGDTGYSYDNLFTPYLEDAREVRLFEPFVRSPFQFSNLMAFASLLNSATDPVRLVLTTKAAEPRDRDNEYTQTVLRQKYTELGRDLMENNIKFEFKFDQSLHDRKIETDTGWKIHLGRGLHIFDRPRSEYDLGRVDQTKLKCKKTTIIFEKLKN